MAARVATAFREIRQRFEEAVEQAKSGCALQLTELQKQASLVQNLVDESELLLTNDDYHTIGKVHAFLGRLSEQIASLQSAHEPVLPGPVLNELFPPFEKMAIEIPDFPSVVERYRGLADEEPRFFYSEKCKLYGGVWRVKIYPNGNSLGLGTHLTAFFELLKGSCRPVDYVYRFTAFHARDPSKNVIRDSCSQYRELDSWGWNRAISLEDVLTDPDFLFGDRATLRCELSVRPESYKVLYDLTSASYEALKVKSAALQAPLGRSGDL
jgi:hypothetical protein